MRPVLPLLLACAVVTAASPEWSRFRGPNGSGTSAAKRLPVKFSATENLLWRTPLPPGYSSPVLAEKCLYLTAHEGQKGMTVCLDRQTGKELWRRQAFELQTKPRSVNTPVSPTPVTDGRNVYVFFEAVGLLSYDEQGTERWRVPLGPFDNPYGMANSPILHNGLVVLLADQDTGSYLLAVDAKTGRQAWKTPRPSSQHGYTTPVLYTPRGGVAQLVVSGSYEVAGYSTRDGEKLWWVEGMAWQAKSVPVLGGGMLYVHSSMPGLNDLVKLPGRTWEQMLTEFDKNKDGVLTRDESPDKEVTRLWFLFDIDHSGKIEQRDYDIVQSRAAAPSGLYAIKLGGKGNLTKTSVLWKVDKGLPNIPSPLFYGGVLYVLKEGGILTSYDPKDGTILKQGRVEGALDAYFASPIAADGKLYTAAKDGKVAVLKAGAQWEVLAVNDLGEETWATPALEDGRLYVRTQSAMYCFGAQ
jgi:outer membrane protein assembly factor BamB